MTKQTIMTEPTVYIVHCIDTEGPLYESLNATFGRLKEMFNIEIDATKENLRKLQDKKIPLSGREETIALIVSPQLLEYNDTWDKIDSMHGELLSKNYREKMLDSYDNGWVFNWFCMDHVGFADNPRRRDMGYGNIHNHYLQLLTESSSEQDGLHFHYHPVSFNKKAHCPATHYFSTSPKIFEIISRRIIDHNFFPSVFRPGFHTTRPDSHWFLEQFIPFEYANQSGISDSDKFNDIGNGRFGDWRRAPVTWKPYHPSHDDYQKEGQCRRFIARSLNIGTRSRNIAQADVDMAFKEAHDGLPVIMSFNNHDYRDIRPDVDVLRGLIKESSLKYPDVKYKFSEAKEAFQNALMLEERNLLKFDVEFDNNLMKVQANHKIFGPQPFLCIKTKGGRYFHDNFDFQEPFKSWTYTFDSITFQLSKLEMIGLAANDDYGNTTVVHIDPDTTTVTSYNL